MLQQLTELVWPAAVERLTLTLNHVLASETEATSRLAPHVGRIIRLSVDGLPPLLQWPGNLAFRITPAGLLEPADGSEGAPADLALRVDVTRPVAVADALLEGRRPPVAIEGDARLATDVGWLMDHVRWDYADDLSRLFGPLVGGQLARVIGTAGGAVRDVLRRLAALRPGAAGDDGLPVRGS
ncbi:MAG TPA: hypothetical protein VNO84_01290 [Burkholderiaceae bacterium]|nr:hypothetical protein [Burkholderiaceae bacterium]